MTDFTHTKKALLKYDNTSWSREKSWDRAATNRGILWADKREKIALAKVQRAFYRDTKHINCFDNCMRVDLAFMRECCERD